MVDSRRSRYEDRSIVRKRKRAAGSHYHVGAAARREESRYDKPGDGYCFCLNAVQEEA